MLQMNSFNIYLAAPLFNERERALNLKLTEAFEPTCRVYLPQRDGALLVELVKDGMPLSLAEKHVFKQDMEAIRRSQLLVAVLDGAHIDEGVAFEIGAAYSYGIECLGLQTDVRRALPTGNNPMIECSLEEIFSCTNDLVSAVLERSHSYGISNDKPLAHMYKKVG